MKKTIEEVALSLRLVVNRFNENGSDWNSRRTFLVGVSDSGDRVVIQNDTVHHAFTPEEAARVAERLSDLSPASQYQRVLKEMNA